MSYKGDLVRSVGGGAVEKNEKSSIKKEKKMSRQQGKKKKEEVTRGVTAIMSDRKGEQRITMRDEI